MVGIYKISNIQENKCYIGQSIDISARWQQHIYEARTLRSSRKLYVAMHNNIENFIFEILEECELNSKILNEKEKYWIEYYDSYNNGYNMTKGGQGEDSRIYDPNIIRQLWDEGYSVGEIVSIVKCSPGLARIRLTGYSDYNAHTSHSRGALRAIALGKMKHLECGTKYQFNDDNNIFLPAIEVHQYALQGKYLNSYPSLSTAARSLGHTKPGQENNISHAITHTNNQKTAFGYQWSLKKVDKMPPCSEHLGKLIQCIETGEIFSSTVAAANWCKLKNSNPIKNYCSGKYGYKSAGKHPETGIPLHWQYIEIV